MTPTTLLGFQERKRELTIKRNYAFSAYIDADAAAREAMKTMTYCDNELLCLELDLQKFNAEQNRAASDAAWAAIEGGERKWF